MKKQLNLNCKCCGKFLLNGVDPSAEERRNGYILIRCCGLLHKINIEKEEEERLIIIDQDVSCYFN